jgi:hypothetical protein
VLDGQDDVVAAQVDQKPLVGVVMAGGQDAGGGVGGLGQRPNP